MATYHVCVLCIADVVSNTRRDDTLVLTTSNLAEPACGAGGAPVPSLNPPKTFGKSSSDYYLPDGFILASSKSRYHLRGAGTSSQTGICVSHRTHTAVNTRSRSAASNRVSKSPNKTSSEGSVIVCPGLSSASIVRCAGGHYKLRKYFFY